jgi:large subunit ribosomal protein L49
LTAQSPTPPTSPETSPSRAADLAAAEATTEADNPQPAIPKPSLPSSRSESSSQPKTKTKPARKAPPPPKYHVQRTKSANLPIYTDYKRGGNLHLTYVRKITGDVIELRDDLRHFLRKEDADVKVNDLTKTIVIKVCLRERELESCANIA